MIKLIEETLMIKTGHITEEEVGIEKDLGKEETVDQGIEVDPPIRIKLERRYNCCREPGHLTRECQKKKRDQGKQGDKTQMQQIAEVAEGSWLDLWPGTMQEEVEDQIYTVEAYKMMNGMCEDEGMKELNLPGANVKTPDICPWKRKEELDKLS